MLKKDTLGTASAKSLSDAFKCAECLHFKQSSHPHKEAVCSKQGVRAFAIAPKCYTPDVTKVIKNSEEFVVLASIFNSYTPQQKRILLGMLRGTKVKKEYKFGTKLYLKTGKDVLTSYLCGFVVGYTSAGELILAGSPDRKTAGSAFFAYLSSDEGLLTSKEWRIKKKELIESGMISDRREKKLALNDKYLDYEVPTIDTHQDFFDAPKSKKRRNSRTTELTEFIVS